MDDSAQRAAPEPLPLPFVRPSAVWGPRVSSASLRYMLDEHRVRPTDVVISSYPKCGTTLLQWMCHLLRSGCDTEVEDLYTVSPWLAHAFDMQQDLSKIGCEYAPRVYKSHQALSGEVRGCRYVVALREPRDVAVSKYNFFRAKNLPPSMLGGARGVPRLNELVCVNSFMNGGRGGQPLGLWHTYCEYWLVRDCSSVLVLVYEDLVRDLAGHARLLADHLGVAASDELIARVARECSKEGMLKHVSKLDDSWASRRMQAIQGEKYDPSWNAAAKVVADNGPTKTAEVLDQHSLSWLQDKWASIVTPATGLASYADMAAAFRQRNQAKLAAIDARRAPLHPRAVSHL
jgi:hypothetical protein